jgi:hypothetical protein
MGAKYPRVDKSNGNVSLLTFTGSEYKQMEATRAEQNGSQVFRGANLKKSILSLCFVWRGRGDKFLETRIVPERIEHWIEPEQCRSERHVCNQWASVRYRE